MTEHARIDYWQIDALPDDVTDIPVDGHPGPEETLTYGESYTMTVRLSPESNSENDYWPDHLERYNRLINTFGGHAGQFALHELTSGKVAYTEPHEGESLLFRLTPPHYFEAGRGGYYLVESVSDQTTLPETVCLVEFDLVFLAGQSEYETVDDAQSFLEADSI